ncbi:MAG: hypothetical protein WCL46_03510 [Chlorobium sp.]
MDIIAGIVAGKKRSGSEKLHRHRSRCVVSYQGFVIMLNSE